MRDDVSDDDFDAQVETHYQAHKASAESDAHDGAARPTSGRPQVSRAVVRPRVCVCAGCWIMMRSHRRCRLLPQSASRHRRGVASGTSGGSASGATAAGAAVRPGHGGSGGGGGERPYVMDGGALFAASATATAAPAASSATRASDAAAVPAARRGASGRPESAQVAPTRSSASQFGRLAPSATSRCVHGDGAIVQCMFMRRCVARDLTKSLRCCSVADIRATVSLRLVCVALGQQDSASVCRSAKAQR